MSCARLQLQAGFLSDMLFLQTQNTRSETGILRSFIPHFSTEIDIALVYTNRI